MYDIRDKHSNSKSSIEGRDESPLQTLEQNLSDNTTLEAVGFLHDEMDETKELLHILQIADKFWGIPKSVIANVVRLKHQPIAPQSTVKSIETEFKLNLNIIRQEWESRRI